MIVFLNGDFLEEAAAHIPVGDRGFLYGDGVFETIRTAQGRPLLWGAHLERLHRGLELLGFRRPSSEAGLGTAVNKLLKKNQLTDAIVRITVTRGSGPRGYSPEGANHPTLLITAQPAPEPFGGPAGLEGWDLITSQYRLSTSDRLASAKHTNRLLSILARAEAEAAGAHEALLLNTEGDFAEAAGSNVFWLEAPNLLLTPQADSGALLGVMRGSILEVAPALGLVVRHENAHPSRLGTAVGIFLTNSIHLLVPVRSLDGHVVPRSPWINLIINCLRETLLSNGAALPRSKLL